MFDQNALVRERGLEVIRTVFATARCEASQSLVNDILYYAFRTTELWVCMGRVTDRLTDYEVNITAACILLLFELPPAFQPAVLPCRTGCCGV